MVSQRLRNSIKDQFVLINRKFTRFRNTRQDLLVRGGYDEDLQKLSDGFFKKLYYLMEAKAAS